MADEKSKQKVITATFFQTPAGVQPVRDWLRSSDLDDADRMMIGGDIRAVEYQWPSPARRELIKSLGGGLWEVRTSVPSDREVRVLFGVRYRLMVIVHGFVKKARKTPKADLDLGRDRWAAWKKANP